MHKNIKHIKRFILTFALVLLTFSTNAQEVRVIDNKGTIQIVSINIPGDIKYGIQTYDHDGWYLLNGRSVNDPELSTNAQTVAGSFFGTSGNLPNATDKVLKHPDDSGSQNIGDIGGSPTTTLNANNIPPLSGTTTSGGSHSHSSLNYNTQTIYTHHNGYVPNNVTIASTGTPTNNGNHNHSVSVNSSSPNNSFNRYQPYLVVNTFIYLGL